jgi:Glycosyl hydrolases family 43/F5/8 type C domain
VRTRQLARFVWLAAAIVSTILGTLARGQSPPTASRPNLARTAKVTVSSRQDGSPGANAIDGNPVTEWAGVGPHPWIKLQWKQPVTVGRVVVRDRAGTNSKAQGGKLLFSDGSVVVVDDIAPGGAPQERQFAPRSASWLRLDLFSSLGDHPGLAEIEVYSDGREPPPPAAPVFPAPGKRVTIPGKDPRIMTVDGVEEGRWCAAMWCPFAGTSVKMIGNTGPARGLADIYIDGIWRKTVDWYCEEPVTDATVFDAANLADGKHLLGVLTRGDKRAASTGTSIHWSRIEYVAGAQPDRFVQVERTRFDPNVPLWLDNRGQPLQCHMGGITYYSGKYYMVGSDWGGKVLPGFPGGWGKNLGMVVYSSPDLMNWTYHGHFCGESNDPKHPLYSYAHGAGRGKLIHARGTGKFVALFQVVGATTFGNVETCEMNATAVAVADRPEGPYRWHGFLQIDGKRVQGSDTAVFTDDDGRQYFICAKSDPIAWNVSDCIYELAPDCLSAVKVKRVGTGGEAPAMFKHHGVYYLLHSQLTGLNVNDNFYHTATNIWGPWRAKGNIAVGDHSANTFMTQTTDVIPVIGKKDAFIWIGDSIRNDTHSYSRTVWLPVTLKGNGEMELRWRDCWDLSIFGK